VKRSHAAAAAVSVGLHLLIPLVILSAPPPAEPPAEPPPVMVTLFELPPPPPPPPPAPPAPAGEETPSPAPATPAPPVPAKAPPPVKVRPAAKPPPAYVEPLLANPAPTPEPFATLSDAQLVGARTAGGGPGGGGGGAGSGSGGQPCDMVRRLQGALRQDPDVRAAVSQAHRATGSGKAILVWNGDWLRNPGQEGKGLAGVRQAIVMEVAFAPEACRAEPMRGLVLISMNDGSGAGRLALGSGAWRWSDLLSAHSGAVMRR
jgi:hypothetical protein